MMNRSVMQRQMFKNGGPVKMMERGGEPTGQMATFVNPQSGERVTLDMANEADVQMMDQLVSAGFVMDSPKEAPRMSMNEMMSAAQNLYEAPQPIGANRGPGGMQEAVPIGGYNGPGGMQEAVGMQMGGDPMIAAMQQQAPVDQGVASMMAPEAMPTTSGPSAGDIDEASVAQMLTDVAPNFADPEEAEDFETMMNSVRGDEASVEQRRMELASLVGEEDAMKTPESVLALVQPVVQMSLVDEGIGGLAEQEMQEPVEGDMAGGIMSMMGG